MRISTCFYSYLKVCSVLAGLFLSSLSFAHEPMVTLIQKVKPSVVGVGLFNPLSAPKTQLQATGFAIGDGSLIATNAHAVPDLEPFTKQEIAVLLPGKKVKVVKARLVVSDKPHDLAILKIEGQRLTPLELSNQEVFEGTSIAFTGFPIGAILGLHPTTHTGLISAIAPVILPVPKAAKLTPQQLRMLRNPYDVYQLDATAYPGNSGSPVYDVHSGEVVAVINKVLLTGNKESALTNPSAITYAIPVKHLKELLAKI